ncbi:MAG5620 family putative phospho-sugar mutase [Mycoplasma procyoni]|uniref:MAG5620 family putative phospho-sugar mutase n=1 Tax=Mycoplasma procyoni TaxID=568784 RepID=UPI00197CAFC9|nr:hypothetical protein [Mycoplasma procyoni]MBN3534599.1 hypothetical protein [Mycoplasma procyoni]
MKENNTFFPQNLKKSQFVASESAKEEIFSERNLKVLALAIAQLSKPQDQTIIKVLSCHDNDKFSKKIINIINQNLNQSHIKVFSLKESDFVLKPIFDFVAKSSKFAISFYCYKDKNTNQYVLEIYNSKFNLFSSTNFELLKQKAEQLQQEVFSNSNIKSDISILSTKNIFNEFISKTFGSLDLNKDQSRILSVGFLSQNYKIDQLQKHLIGNLDFKYYFLPFFKKSKNKALKLKLFSFYKKPDVIIDIYSNGQKIDIYIKENKKYRKMTLEEQILFLIFFKNYRTAEDTKIINNFNSIFNFDLLNQKMSNSSKVLKQQIELLENQEIEFSYLNNLVKQNPFVKVILILNFLNYQKTQNSNFDKTKEIFKKMNSFKGIIDFEVYGVEQVEDLIEELKLYDFKVIDKQIELLNYWDQIYYFESNTGEKIKIFADFSLKKLLVFINSDNSIKYKQIINKLFMKGRNDN